MPQVLCYFDYACQTGFSTVTHNLMKRLPKYLGPQWKFDIIAINYLGQEYRETKQITVIPAEKQAIDKKVDITFYRDSIVRLLSERDYDFFFCLQDLQIISPIYSWLIQIKNKKPKIKWIYYFPVDSKPHFYNVLVDIMIGYVEYHTGVDFFDEIVTFTNYGKKQIEEVYELHRPEKLEEISKKIKVIGHGNENEFYPLPKDEIIRFKNEFFGENKIVIGQVNRNNPRKDFPTSMNAFTQVKKGFEEIYHKDLIYYCHTNPNDEKDGFNLLEIAASLGFNNGIYWPNIERWNNGGFDKKWLNQLYNSLDIFFTTTTAEGWGLTVMEAFCCKIPVIAPIHTSLKELTLNGNLCLSPINEFEPTIFRWDNNYWRDKCTIDNTIMSLNYGLYYLEKELEEPGSTEIQKCLNRAFSFAKSFDWDNIAEKWTKIFIKNNLHIL